MGLKSKFVKLLFVVALALALVGLALPVLKQQLGITGNTVDLKVRVPFTSQPLAFDKIPVDATIQQDSLVVGGSLLVLLLLWKFFSLSPAQLLTDLRKKKEIHSELKKMDSTLEQIKRLGQGFD